MAKNIEEFLKLAAAKRQQGGQQPPPAPEPIPEPPPRRLAEPEVIEIVDEVQVVDPLRTQSVGVHVQTHINTSDIAEHAEHLGERVVQVHDRTDARIHQKFDQKVGHLGADSIADIGEVSAARTDAYDSHRPSERAAEIASLFHSRKNIQQAILLREILDRPDWD